MSSFIYADPVLSCQQAGEFERSILKDEAAEWSAMVSAGKRIAEWVIRDYLEFKIVPERLRILALIGKGNNAGDALIACAQILADYPRACVELILTSPPDDLRPLAARALQELEGRVHAHQVWGEEPSSDFLSLLHEIGGDAGFHLCIDGLLGMSFKPPLKEPLSSLIEAVNAYELIDIRASVDLPSGKGDASDGPAFDADFTYATGIAKRPVFGGVADCGRVRFIDLGFFTEEAVGKLTQKESILSPRVLEPMRRLRPAVADKRAFGHLFIVGGSAYMPGALLMSVQAAVRSGVGLVTAFAPASVAAALSAQVPEAMWIPWPETNNGTLNPKAIPLLLDRIGKATAVLVGPGMGQDRNTELVAQEIVKLVELPVVLDADALRLRVMEVAQKRKPHFGTVVATPHMGEFIRIAKLSDSDFSIQTQLDVSKFYRIMTVLKGPNTRICDGDSVIYSTHGGPVLSRGGSGDILAGLLGGIVAQDNDHVRVSVCQGVMLHGLAAERLARARGQVAVRTTQILEYISEVLREA